MVWARPLGSPAGRGRHDPATRSRRVPAMERVPAERGGRLATGTVMKQWQR
jgi:hypothetical protein